MNTLHGSSTGTVRAKGMRPPPTSSPQATGSLLGMDRWLLLASAILVLIGIAMIFSVSYVDIFTTKGAEPDLSLAYRPLIIQSIWFVLGGLMMVLSSRCSMRFWQQIAPGLLVVNLVMVALTFVEPFRVVLNGAQRWIEIPGVPFARFQPSELLKLTTILFFARWFEPLQTRKNGRAVWWILCILWLVGCALVEKQPDLGTAFMICLIGFGTAFLGGLSFGKVATILATGAFLVVGFTFAQPYRVERLKAFLDPWTYYKTTGYQMCRAQLAVGGGGLFGEGLGDGREKRYLPAAQTDYIFATLAEETGFAGSIACLVLLALVTARCFAIALRSSGRFGKLVAGGVGIWIAAQAAMNLAMALGAIPPIGVPLPFVSFGGSSLCVLLVALGIVHGVQRTEGRV
jgi:cell division protein FtsW